MPTEIKNCWTGAVILTVEAENLRGADLSGADLSGADLSGA
ncbi:MAG: pentapeptide repeat-containing protein, partial [Cyanobacteria bacterium J06582_2]